MRKWMKRAGIGFGTLALVLVLSAIAVYAASEARLNQEFSFAAKPLAVRPDPSMVTRGEHLATAIGKCTECHGPDLGGKVFIENPAFGTLIAPNLTGGRGGALARYADDAMLERAIRHGISDAGRGLLIMPSDEYYHLSDADLAALIAYLRALPPVDRELPASTVGPVARALYVAGKLPLLTPERVNHTAAREAPAAGVTVEYGKYLTTVGGCTGCHGPELAGGPTGEPGKPPAANLTPRGLSGWTEQDFFNALRKGIKPGGSPIDPFMPWQATAKMTDDEIRAVWMYLKTVPPRDFPGA
ncbi:MAG TPA: cytochrome c [Longimicrobium sp.]|nr:cytochrome c [Longimicrobium sp.]